MVDDQNGPNLHLILRIPLAADGQGESVKIEQAYREAFGEAGDNPKFKIYAALVILVGLPALTGFIVLVVHLVKRFGLN